MREVGAFEAKNKLGQLLDLVEQGEEVTITRHGKAIARLAPLRTTHDREQARAANQRIRARARSKVRSIRLGRVEGLPRRGSPVSLVLDSSTTLAWIFGDETTESIAAVFEMVANHGA